MVWRQLSPLGALAAGVIVLISIAAGLQNDKFKGDGQDVFDLGPAPTELAISAPEIEMPRLGLRYEHIGMMGIDVWRYSGHLVVYENHDSFIDYRDLTDDQADELGLSVPWRYHLPEGLIALACLAELIIVARRPRTIRFALVAGVALAAIAIVFRFEGLTWECVFPALLAMLHLYTGLDALWSDRRDGDVQHAPEPTPVRTEPRAAPPTFEKDPFRGPPQPPPLALHREATKPTAPPIDFRDDAEPPKVLR